MVFGLAGVVGGGLTVQIDIQPDQYGLSTGQIVPIDHEPSWKLGKNPFQQACINKTLNQNAAVPGAGVGGGQMDNNNMYANNNNGFIPQQQQNGMNMGIDRGYAYNGGKPMVYAYSDVQDIQGVVNLIIPHGKRYEHLGIKVQFLGRVDVSHAVYEGRPHYDFISLTKELCAPGTLYQAQTSIPFHFRTDEKPYETYHGRNVSVRYFIRVLVDRKFFPAIKKDEEMVVQLVRPEPRINEPIKMEVGIEECLHIEFQYRKKYYHLNDCIVGDIHFMLVRIKIKYMELAVIRRETSGEGVVAAAAAQNGVNTGAGSGSVVTETQTLTKFEIMDGAPVKGEIIPVRLYLGGIPADLTPTFNSGNNRFTVRYYLNLVLVDEEDRRYFKQQEIILWRKQLG